MGKAKRLKAARAAAPPPRARRIVWVDACEVGQHQGSLTLRAGAEGKEPLLVALPGRAVPALPDTLQTASIDAEEEYWEVMVPLVQSLPPEELQQNPDAADAVVSTWVLNQDWQSVVNRIPAPENEVFLVSHVGYVGLALPRPFTREPTLAIFDPMQLRRLDSAFRTAISTALRSTPSPFNEDTVAATLLFLGEQPWGNLRRADPTPEYAKAEMLRRRTEFLSRTPYLRPDEHNVPAIDLDGERQSDAPRR